MSNSIAAQLHTLVSRIARESDQILQEQLGIGLSQYKIMTTLQQQPHIRQRAIAASLAQTEASISRQIHLLSEKGMLTADKNPDNLREHLADLTPKGLRLIDAADVVLSSYHQTFFAGLNPRQKERFSEMLSQLLTGNA